MSIRNYSEMSIRINNKFYFSYIMSDENSREPFTQSIYYKVAEDPSGATDCTTHME